MLANIRRRRRRGEEQGGVVINFARFCMHINNVRFYLSTHTHIPAGSSNFAELLILNRVLLVGSRKAL